MRRLQLLRRQYLYFCTSKASKLSACRSRSMIPRLEHTPSRHTSAHVSTRQHTSAYVSIRQHTCRSQSMIPRLEHTDSTTLFTCIRQHTSAYVSIRQHTSAYVTAYVGAERVDDAFHTHSLELIRLDAPILREELANFGDLEIPGSQTASGSLSLIPLAKDW
jgi:hypothetical protein